MPFSCTNVRVDELYFREAEFRAGRRRRWFFLYSVRLHVFSVIVETNVTIMSWSNLLRLFSRSMLAKLFRAEACFLFVRLKHAYGETPFSNLTLSNTIYTPATLMTRSRYSSRFQLSGVIAGWFFDRVHLAYIRTSYRRLVRERLFGHG